MLVETRWTDILERYCEETGYHFNGSHEVVNSFVYGDEHGHAIVSKHAVPEQDYRIVYSVTPLFS